MVRKGPTVKTEDEVAAKRLIPVAVLQKSQVGEYTPEKLAELRKNSKTIYFSSHVQYDCQQDWLQFPFGLTGSM